MWDYCWAHPLVSTPSSILNPIEAWLGITFLKKVKVSPNSPDFHPNISTRRTENQSFALPLSYRGIYF